jgi:predicted Zn finger-like uncharacterized protein
MQFGCQSCKASLSIADDKLRGKRLVVRCRRCGSRIQIADPAFSAGPVLLDRPGVQLAARSEGQGASARTHRPLVANRPLGMGAGARGLASAARSSPPSGRVVEQPIWFAMVAGQQEGPFGAGELARRVRGGAIGPRTYVWKEGMPAWQRCGEVPELAVLFGSRPPLASSPRPAATAAAGEPARAATRRAAEVSLGSVQQRAAGPTRAAERARVPADAWPPAPAPPVDAPPSGPLPGPPAAEDGEPLDAEQANIHLEPIDPEPDPGVEMIHTSAIEVVERIRAPSALAHLQRASGQLASQARSVLARLRPAAADPQRVALAIGGALAALGLLAFALGGKPRPLAQPAARPDAPATAAAQRGASASPPGAARSSSPERRAAAETPPPREEGAQLPLSASAVRKKLEENKRALQGCVDEALRREPGLRLGKIQVAATIAPSGAVSAARIDNRPVDESALGVCLKRITRRIVFPSFAGEPFEVDIPIVVGSGE